MGSPEEEDPPPPLRNDNVSNDVNITMNNDNKSNRNSTIANSQESVYKNTTFTYHNGDHSSSTLDYRKSNGRVTEKGMKRYRNELKHLLPYREAKENSAHLKDYAAKIDDINCFQFIFFTWMNPVVQKIFSGSFTLDDIQTCSPYDSCLQSSRRFKRLWTRQCSNSGLHNASLERTLFKFIRTRFFVSSFFYLICLTTGYLSSTFFVKKLLEEIESSLASIDLPPSDLQNGTSTSTSTSYFTFLSPTSAALQWTAALCLCELLRAISYSIMFAVTIRTGVRTVNALSGALYEKILSKRFSATVSASSTSTSNASNSNNSSGAALQPTNLFANDLGKVFQLVYMLPLVIGSPIIIVVTVAYTFALIGASSAAVGMVAFLAIFALQAVITRKQANIRDRLMGAADLRISLISGLMRDIRTIKFNGWEKPLQADILHCRRSESLLLIRYQYLQCFSTSLALLTPMLITIINILMHTWLGKELSVSTAFSLVMLNYIAAHGIRSLPNYLREIVNGRIALRRIERFLRLDDQTRYLQFPEKDSNGTSLPPNAIEILDASFSWTPPTPPSTEQEFTSYISSPSSIPLHRSNSSNSSFLLSNINLIVPRRRHLCLYGPVGSGKSALLLSILGQTQLFKGEVRLSSPRLAYVSQTPWLQATSIRENVLFGAPFERKRYYETLLKCQLATDIAGLADGEHTVVGEDGRQLSGGQKMRIALARAVYSDADILLFDDLFSALDGRVVRTIFSGVFGELLVSKTVVFVTRHLHLLQPKTMVAMLEGGRVKKVGEHGTLLEEDEEYRRAVDRSKLVGTSKDTVKEEENNETLPVLEEEEVEDHQQLNGHAEELKDIVEFYEDEDEDEDEDDNQENVLFKNSNRTLPYPLKTATNASTTSYTSLISLLEKCDQNNNSSNQFPLINDSEFTDDEESHQNRVLDDPEARLFCKYSAKYRKKFSSDKKKISNGNGNTNSNSKKIVSKQVAISGQTYADYIRASGGWPAFALMLALFAAQTATATFASWWLSYWLSQGAGGSRIQESNSQNLDSATMEAEHRTLNTEDPLNSSAVLSITPSIPSSSSSILSNPHLHYYQTVYLVLLLVVVLTSLLMGCTYARIAVRAANALHWATLSKLITSPLAFFDAISLGRILNLFSHNIDELDGQLPVALDGFAQRALLVLGSFLLIIITLHWLFSVPFLLFAVVFILIYRHYRSATYWLKQADLRLRSPIYGYLSATVEGLSVVKAFTGAEERFTRAFFRLVDRQAAGHWLSLCAVRWLSIRIDLLCIAANVVVCLLVLVNLRAVGAAYAGLVITQSMQLSGLLQLVVRLALDLETRLVSVERLQAYIRLLRSERSTTMELPKSQRERLNFDLSQNSSDNSSVWPSAGRISFREVSLRYRANLPLALKSVTFDVPAGSKVAIVGRTGAGKSSVTYALFRLVEIVNNPVSSTRESSSSGIYIDGVDIRAVPLEVLRSRLTIIPQDPVLFTGSSIRKNLDPRGKASEEQLLSVLEAVGLKEKIEILRNGLDEPIAAGSAGLIQQSKPQQPQQRMSGTSGGFSTGEKQLLCLARALLRGSRIIVLDEATSAVDDQMEAAIWRLVRTVFADCTVLLIAHRLQTVLDCDHVIVIRKGEVVESGDPKVLRTETRSLFARMISSQSQSQLQKRKK